MEHIVVYTDGSWKSNTKTGGWSCLMTSGIYWQVLSGGSTETTISRMELTAVTSALEALVVPCRVTIISDSMYVVRSVNEWIYSWSLNNWTTYNGKPIKNQDLLLRIFTQMSKHTVTAQWIKAHTDNTSVNYLGNGCVDWFAQNSADTAITLVQ